LRKSMRGEMKIGISTAFLGNLRAGTWTYTYQLLKELSALGGVCALDREERELPGLEGIPRRVFPGGPKALAKFFWPNFVLPRGAAAAGLDLVHCTTPYGTFAPSRYPNVITICDVTPLIYPGTHGRMNVWHHRYLLPGILKRAAAIVTISESSRRDIVRIFGVPEEKVTVTYLAADSRYRPEPEGTPGEEVARLPRPYLLNVGTLEPRKNLDGLLRAFALARHRGIPHKLVVTGARGWGKSRLAALVQELDLGESVIFTGFVEDHDLPHLYAGADFFVYPSLYEGFGLPPLEAMACGVPVITSNVSSLPEVTGDAALLIDPASDGELADAMVRLAGDAGLRDDLRARGLVRAGLFSWQKAAQETLEVYRRVVG
jgi:glycosyltransferase involved in cell wall biosynthesis